MDKSAILDFLEYVIYGGMIGSAGYGLYTVVLLLRRVKAKRFTSESSAGEFLDEVRDELAKKNFDSVAEICDSPVYWNKAVVQLIQIAIENRRRPPKKLRQMLAEKFERDILADLEYRSSWVATVVKAAPMLGLLGTVLGMIKAFSTIAGAGASGVNPADLAEDIGLALGTTAYGLTIAIPLVMLGALVAVRMGKLQDSVAEHLGIFLEDLEDVMAEGGTT